MGLLLNLDFFACKAPGFASEGWIYGGSLYFAVAI